MFQLIIRSAIAALVTGLASGATVAYAQMQEIQTTYSTQKGTCDQGADKLVTISQGQVAGPGFDCQISNPTPAGTGMEAYTATCSVDGNEITDTLAMDLGNNPDHFAVAIPGREDWIDLYPCTKVPGLE